MASESKIHPADNDNKHDGDGNQQQPPLKKPRVAKCDTKTVYNSEALAFLDLMSSLHHLDHRASSRVHSYLGTFDTRELHRLGNEAKAMTQELGERSYEIPERVWEMNSRFDKWNRERMDWVRSPFMISALTGMGEQNKQHEQPFVRERLFCRLERIEICLLKEARSNIGIAEEPPLSLTCKKQLSDSLTCEMIKKLWLTCNVPKEMAFETAFKEELASYRSNVWKLYHEWQLLTLTEHGLVLPLVRAMHEKIWKSEFQGDIEAFLQRLQGPDSPERSKSLVD